MIYRAVDTNTLKETLWLSVHNFLSRNETKDCFGRFESNLSTFYSLRYLCTRVARWFVFKPEIQIWVNFRGPWIGKNGYILWPFGIFYGHLGYFMTIWYILCSFGTFVPVLVSWTNKNLATLLCTMPKSV
jgi:hypothetical protein